MSEKALTSQAKTQAEIIRLLGDLGGRQTAQSDIVFEGTRMVLPSSMDAPQAIDMLRQYVHDQEENMSFERTFKYRPWDGARAAAQAIYATFGLLSQQAVHSFWGTEPPSMITIQTNVGQTEEVPWGRVSIPALAGVYLDFGQTRDVDLGVLFHITVTGPRKWRHEVAGLFELIEKELAAHSMYRGKAFDGQAEPNFIDLSAIDPDKVVYSAEVMVQLEANVWTLLEHEDACKSNGISLKRSVLFEGPYGTGKQQPVSEPVLTPAGWRTMGDLLVGDQVISVDGSPATVLQVFPQSDQRVLRVTFSDGSSTRVGHDHLWEVERGVGSWRTDVLTTDQMVEMGARNRHGQHQLRIPTVSPIQFPHADLPIDPYALGVILGDGHITSNDGRNAAGHVTLTTDKEIVDMLAITAGREFDHPSVGVTNVATSEWRDALVSLGLGGTRSHTKFVPAMYLTASVEQRRALLAGLLDTDGSPDGSGVEFSSASRALVDAVVELTRSLGGTASPITERVTHYTYGGETHEERPSFRTMVHTPQQPHRLLRKMVRWSTPAKGRGPVRYVESITTEMDEESVCILVDHPRHLYVTADYIVTHNTLAGYITAQKAIEHGWTFIFCRPGRDDLEQAMRTARLYQPSVVFYEDVEDVGGSEDVTRLLDLFDGIEAKGTRILCMLTTNHADQIHKGMLRPGRLDSVITVKELDAAGIQRLISVTLDERYIKGIDDDGWRRVTDSMVDFMPAFVTEAAGRAMRYSIASNHGMAQEITADDLVNAAVGLQPQLQMHQEAGEGKAPEAVGAAIRREVQEAVGQMEWNGVPIKVADRD